jgi:hypothetical protein
VRGVIEQITDPLVRAVAEDRWLSGDPSPDSGNAVSAGGKPSLANHLGKSRDQVVRAKYAGDARIIAGLEHLGVPPEWLDPFRKKSR